MSDEVGSDSGREAISWGRGQEEEAASSDRIVEGLDEDEVLSPAPITAVPPRVGPSFPSEVSEGQLREWHQMYRIPDDIEFVVPGPDDRADDPPLGTVALNQAILAAGLRLPFPRVVRKFLREWGIAPTQLCPNGWRILIGLLVLWDQLGFPRPSIGDFHSLYSFKSDGKRSGWWYASFAEDDARPDLSIPVRYHELRYVAQEPTGESSERARRAREISENLRSSAVLITEENLISARLSRPVSDRPIAHRPEGNMKDISALLRKKNQGPIQAGRGKRKVPAGDQDRSSRPRVESELPPRPENSPARSVEEVPAPAAVRPEPSSSQTVRPQLQPTYLGSTAEKDEEFLRLWGTLPKPVRDFLRSNSPTREEIAGLPLSSRRAIKLAAKCWTPVQQKYLDGMGVVDSVVAASVNVSRAAIQLTSASEKMARLVSEVQVMRDEGRKADELERAAKARADLEAELEAERKKNSELQAALENSTAKEEVVAEFRSSDAYLAEQEVVYFLTMEELIESTAEKRPDWDLQFLKDELADLKRKSTLNPPSPGEADPDQAGAEE
ncbi:Uncharacterized protein Adt_21582 [Abeliophyllum distichum]|uniref:Transposase (putative) gypsy type domain-containing protein n=1 Tax=Abeliophyllum distichum TaxID=126358 RepID=A0ABD1SZZ8_9LAMI